MISTRHRFIFIHVPKTGGNAIQKILLPFADDNITTDNPHQDGIQRFGLRNPLGLAKHATLNDYRLVMNADLFRKCFRFCTVRNPWERAVSYYFSPHRGDVCWKRSEFIKLLSEIKPMRYYIGLDDEQPEPLGLHMDFLIHFERLSDDFKEVCDRLHIECGTIKHLNESSRQHYSSYYDAELMDLVRDRFAEDVAFGNYSFDS